ncbi:hypothetical protein RHMOL_Rhmol04G0268200 [Rhododendron molle]|uniref:Uncharacterized protein n=1 Tax=Rhododendron molle TaxID=49168 RepID=A0ACC0P6C1_RHOML|nr:hypothetical protein RHMOL_Rhmol04G0268200 [Rhododendron molle]
MLQLGTERYLIELIFGAHVQLDELYAVNVSDRWTDAGKAAPKAVQHEAAQHAPLVRSRTGLNWFLKMVEYLSMEFVV